MEIPERLKSGDVYRYAKKLMKPEDIDHHDRDLYLKVNDVSKELVSALRRNYPFAPKLLLSKFVATDGSVWYKLVFCYNPNLD